MKRDVYRAYGIDRRSGPYEMDHLVPLAIGGSDEPSNLWPEEREGEWGAEVKGRLEWRLVQLVCGRAVDAGQAQHDIATDWIAAYGKYCPSPADCPGCRATHGRGEQHLAVIQVGWLSVLLQAFDAMGRAAAETDGRLPNAA